MLDRLRRWWRKRPTVALADWQFVLYTRTGCHLCDTAWKCLEAARRRYHIGLDVVDVDSDPGLVALHGNEVPVVLVNGQVRFRGGVNRVLLERLLGAEVARREKHETSEF